MSAPEPTLDQVERWMRAVITDPAGVVAGIDSDDAREQIDVTSQRIEQVICPSRSQTAVERLAIYANAYYARLLECLREEFPALRHAVGDEPFDRLAFAYLQAYPSRSYTLANLGVKFPQFLAETRPALEDASSAAMDWPTFLIELATLERSYSEIFDGPGVENLPPLESAKLAAIPAALWTELRLVPVPCLRLFEFRFPVHEYATAVRHGELNAELEIPDPKPTYLAVTRRNYVVRRLALSRTQFRLLESLVAGHSLGDALARCAESTSDPLDVIAQNLTAWFREWMAMPFFAEVSLGQGEQ